MYYEFGLAQGKSVTVIILSQSEPILIWSIVRVSKWDNNNGETVRMYYEFGFGGERVRQLYFWGNYNGKTTKMYWKLGLGRIILRQS